MMNWNDLLNSDRLRPSTRAKIVDPRNEFESDFGRIIFSPAIRRMHDKTQVFPLTTDDNIHSRLTHSLEVMAIGYSLGLRLSENEEFIQKSGLDKNQVLRQIPIILENICLIHDIGNPPFGHFGEEVIKNYFKKLFSNCNYGLSKQERDDFELFDGNAQGFRVLTKLQVLDDAYGLNLSISTLAAFLKYPNSDTIDKSRLCTKKRGVYQTEKNYLMTIATKCGMFIENGLIARHPLSFLMEAADSICYLVMDIEDGFNKNWYDYNDIEIFFSNNETLKSILEKGKTEVKMNNEISKMVKFRINTISYLVSLTLKNFVKNYDLIMNGKYNEELINDDENNIAKDLFSFCKKNIFPKKEILKYSPSLDNFTSKIS
jgi:dGTPase